MDRRKLIADAAIDVIADEGLRSLTHRKLDELLALPPGSASYYFRTKSELIGAVIARITEDSQARFHEFVGEDPVERTSRYLESVLTDRSAQIRARHALLVDPSVDADARAGLAASLFSIEGAENLMGDRDLGYGYVALCEGLVVAGLTVGWTTASLRSAIVTYLSGAGKR